MHTPFRYDYVGSFLRPGELKAARAAYEKGNITATELKELPVSFKVDDQ